MMMMMMMHFTRDTLPHEKPTDALMMQDW